MSKKTYYAHLLQNFNIFTHYAQDYSWCSRHALCSKLCQHYLSSPNHDLLHRAILVAPLLECHQSALIVTTMSHYVLPPLTCRHIVDLLTLNNHDF